jgi:putative FmdB family regulatory protein
MPTYDYKCLKYEHRFEAFQKMTEDPLTTCPECGGEVKRLIGAGSRPIFKGSGFYQTDYKNSSQKPNKKNTKKSEQVAPVVKPDQKTTTKTTD